MVNVKPFLFIALALCICFATCLAHRVTRYMKDDDETELRACHASCTMQTFCKTEDDGTMALASTRDNSC